MHGEGAIANLPQMRARAVAGGGGAGGEGDKSWAKSCFSADIGPDDCLNEQHQLMSLNTASTAAAAHLAKGQVDGTGAATVTGYVGSGEHGHGGGGSCARGLPSQGKSRESKMSEMPDEDFGPDDRTHLGAGFGGGVGGDLRVPNGLGRVF